MATKTNVYDINPRSKNQLMTLIYLLEIHNIDTKDIDLTDWESLTVRLSLDYNVEHRAKFKTGLCFSNLQIRKIICHIRTCRYRF